MATFHLPPHVHFCLRGDEIVFLDLKRDDYTLVDGSAAAAIRELLDSSPSIDAEDHGEVLREVLQEGLLTAGRGAGRPVAATQIEFATTPLIEPDARQGISITPRHVARFWMACAVAAARLRWSHIDSTVSGVQRRKARCVSTSPLEIKRARELTAIFLKLRAFFPRAYICLFDSLALIEFLAAFRIFPTWVFGVRLDPWAAHCWVQEQGMLFNDNIERTAGYTPIMAI